uniref:ATP synthase mitochondrial F1 complex assembly factor 2 n=1 Tax=Araucaria cunninghamii TaxID=56994 RepID=A0A0D6R8R0_ARACU
MAATSSACAKMLARRMKLTLQKVQNPSSMAFQSSFESRSRNYRAAAATTKESNEGNNNNDDNNNNSETIYNPSSIFGESFATMPLSSATGSITGKRFYKNVTTRKSEDGTTWNVMLDYRTLRTPAKRPLNLPTLALAQAIAAEWEYQVKDGIRPFTMPLMRLSCTALERVPLTRDRIIKNLLRCFHTDQVFCRAPADSELTGDVHDMQVQLMDPLLDWVESLLGVRPIIYTSIFGGKQSQEVVDAIECLIKKTNNWELAAIDALAASANSLTIAIALLHHRLEIEEAMKLIRLEEDLQVDKWGLVEGGHDIDMADMYVQISSPIVLLDLVQS